MAVGHACVMMNAVEAVLLSSPDSIMRGPSLSDKVVDVGVAIISMVLEIILIFAAAQPRAELGDAISRERGDEGAIDCGMVASNPMMPM